MFDLLFCNGVMVKLCDYDSLDCGLRDFGLNFPFRHTFGKQNNVNFLNKTFFNSYEK